MLSPIMTIWSLSAAVSRSRTVLFRSQARSPAVPSRMSLDRWLGGQLASAGVHRIAA